MAKQLRWKWTEYFSGEVLTNGMKDAKRGLVEQYQVNATYHAVSARIRGFYVSITPPRSYEDVRTMRPWNRPPQSDYHYDYGYNGRLRLVRDTVSQSEYRFSCNCTIGARHGLCRHVAALIYQYEKMGGAMVFTQTAEELAAEKEQKRREEEEEKRRREEEMRRKEKEQLEKEHLPVDSFMELPADSEELYFHPAVMTKDFVINRYEVYKAAAIEAKKTAFVSNGIIFHLDSESERSTDITWKRFSVQHEGDGQVLYAALDVCGHTVKFQLADQHIVECSCDCGNITKCKSYLYWNADTLHYDKQFCAHALFAWRALAERIYAENPGDATDARGDAFLKFLTRDLTVSEEKPAETSGVIRKECIVLVPRLIRKTMDDDPELGFYIGRQGERTYVVRDTEGLIDAFESGTPYRISKKTAFDFSCESFVRDAFFWFDLMKKDKVRNDRLRKVYGYYNYYASDHSSSGGVILTEEILDSIFEKLVGGSVLYSLGAAEYSVPVQEASDRLPLTITSEMNAETLVSVRITGRLPEILDGAGHKYILDKNQFSQLTDDAVTKLAPLLKLADASGKLDFHIGRKHLAEFYYRGLPQLQASGLFEIRDRAKKEAAEVLPEEAQFTFFLDLPDDRVICRVTVRYGDEEELPLLKTGDPGLAGRDLLQEKRVEDAVLTFFPAYDQEHDVYEADAGETTLPWILMTGVDTLSRFGEVKGTEAFRRLEVRPMAAPKISVSLESNILDLSIQTTDMDEDDLCEVLESYHLRKKWHRLKSGSFISLEESAAELDDLVDLADSLGISLTDAVKGKVSVPKYRAMYVDRLLEEHDQIASSRNRSFKALIRSFRTIEDSDFEVPADLSGKMRPYQSYGYEWLRTLAVTGFGGILADEMGLGKTLQMLSCIEGIRQDGEQKAFLVVCPASLVYNWKEEVQKFTPSLATILLAGKKNERRDALKDLKSGNGADLYITSYDLIKRDVTMYDGITFAGIVLDEAQFAKNQNTAVARALKTLRADTRFALTGTPIENRLSELWNIFDFLMPGFLYTAQDFRQKFELPIVKEKDENAAERLSLMTRPFILRRRKNDVLKDLPEKLEETQTAQMDEEQRHLYDAEVVRIRRILEQGQYNQDRFKILSGITRLRQICCDPSLLFDNYEATSAKREACLDLIERSIDAGHKILLFSQFTSMLEILEHDLKKRKISYYKLTGATPKKDRVDMVDAFNKNDVPIFLISLRAGGTGLNLTSADVVIHYDPWWNVAVMNQATDRAHRIGQTKKVTVVKLITAGTIEEKIMDLQKSKSDLADQILSGKSESLAAFTDEEVLRLLE